MYLHLLQTHTQMRERELSKTKVETVRQKSFRYFFFLPHSKTRDSLSHFSTERIDNNCELVGLICSLSKAL